MSGSCARRTKLLLALATFLTGTGLAAASPEVLARWRERRLLELLDDTSTTPNRADFYAWHAKHIAVLRRSPSGAFELEECWSGQVPTARRFELAKALVPEWSRRVREPSRTPRHAALSRIVVFDPEQDTGMSPSGVALLESGRFLLYRAPFGRSDDAHVGLYPVGGESTVRARVAYVTALRRAFEAVGERPDVLETVFARSDIARWEAFERLAACGPSAVPALKRILESSTDVSPTRLLELLVEAGDPDAIRLAGGLLECDLAFWRRVARDLGPGWAEASDDVDSRMFGSLGLVAMLAESSDPSSRELATEFLDFYATLPPPADRGFGRALNRMATACRRRVAPRH